MEISFSGNAEPGRLVCLNVNEYSMLNSFSKYGTGYLNFILSFQIVIFPLHSTYMRRLATETTTRVSNDNIRSLLHILDKLRSNSCL